MIARLALASLAIALSSCSHRGADQVNIREPDTASRLHVADTAAASGQTDIALSMYAAAARSAPDDTEVQGRYIGLLVRTAQAETARQALDEALARNPRDPTLRRWLAVMRLEAGANAEALQIFTELLARKPRDLNLLNGRAMALDLGGQHAEAQQGYRAALSLAPSDVRTINNLAVSYLLAGQPAEASTLLLPVAQQTNAPARILNNLAIAQAAASGSTAAVARLQAGPDAHDLSALATALGASPSLGDADPAPATGEPRPAG